MLLSWYILSLFAWFRKIEGKNNSMYITLCISPEWVFYGPIPLLLITLPPIAREGQINRGQWTLKVGPSRVGVTVLLGGRERFAQVRN